MVTSLSWTSMCQGYGQIRLHLDLQEIQVEDQEAQVIAEEVQEAPQQVQGVCQTLPPLWAPWQLTAHCQACSPGGSYPPILTSYQLEDQGEDLHLTKCITRTWLIMR